MRLWHFRRHPPWQGVPYEARTHGDLLEEFYLSVASEIDQLTDRMSDLSSDEITRLHTLERVLDADDSVDDESTGDPLADYWEYRAEHGLSMDLDLKEAPPRELWDSP